MTPIAYTGWTVAAILLGLATIALYYLMIKPSQDAKNERKRKAAKEEESRKQADHAFAGFSTGNKAGQVGEYEDYFECT